MQQTSRITESKQPLMHRERRGQGAHIHTAGELHFRQERAEAHVTVLYLYIYVHTTQKYDN